MGANPYLWPMKSKIAFYNGWGLCLFESTNRRLDLSDSLMLWWKKPTRTIYMGLATDSPKWITWDEDELKSIEDHIRYDLSFDGYQVSIKRLYLNVQLFCSDEFRWKLVIRTKY